MKIFLYLFTVLAILISCNSNPVADYMQPNVSGKPGELLLVLNENAWKGSMGDSLRKTFSQPYPALPQWEPIFSVIQIPNVAFKKLFKLHRNVIRISLDPQLPATTYTIVEDKWAKGQLLVQIRTKHEESFLEFWEDHHQKIVNLLNHYERQRSVKNLEKMENKNLTIELLRKFNMGMKIPGGYQLSMDSLDFAWISLSNAQKDQGFFIYSYPYVQIGQLEKQELIAKRNEMLQQYVHGSGKGSYMTTQIEFPVSELKYEKPNGLYTVELRGLWEMEKAFMAGPFISHTSIDTIRNRVLTVEGYVFAPNQDKRDGIRLLESVLHTIKLRPAE